MPAPSRHWSPSTTPLKRRWSPHASTPPPASRRSNWTLRASGRRPHFLLRPKKKRQCRYDALMMDCYWSYSRSRSYSQLLQFARRVSHLATSPSSRLLTRSRSTRQRGRQPTPTLPQPPRPPRRRRQPARDDAGRRRSPPPCDRPPVSCVQTRPHTPPSPRPTRGQSDSNCHARSTAHRAWPAAATAERREIRERVRRCVSQSE